MINTPTELINRVNCPELELIKSDLTDFANKFPEYFNKNNKLRLSIAVSLNKDGTFDQEIAVGAVNTNYLSYSSYSDSPTMIIKGTDGKISTELMYDTIDVPVIVMNYNNSTVTKYMAKIKLDENGWFSDEDIEKWLSKNTDYDDTNCYYMCGSKDDDIQFIDKTTE